MQQNELVIYLFLYKNLGEGGGLLAAIFFSPL